MTNLSKLWQRVRLGFSITEPLSDRGRMILQQDKDAGYKLVEAVLKANENQKRTKSGVIAENIELANEEYDLIQA